MMGHQQRIQRKLFYTKLNLDQRIRKDHILRKFAKHIDFDFIYKEVKENYGTNGNVSVPPPVILKMLWGGAWCQIIRISLRISEKKIILLSSFGGLVCQRFCEGSKKWSC